MSFPAGVFLNTSTGAHLTTAGIWTNNSDRAAKENFETLDGEELLARVASLPITRWNYKVDGEAVQHIGPTAQDFHAAFGLGQSEKSIGTLDADGVALAAIQELYRVIQERDHTIALLARRLEELERRATQPNTSE